MSESLRNKSIADLSKLWNFWTQAKWYLVSILIFVALMVLYKRETMGVASFSVWIVFIILFMIVILIFNDSNGIMGDSVPFAVSPLPPHLGLDGVSNDVKYSF